MITWIRSSLTAPMRPMTVETTQKLWKVIVREVTFPMPLRMPFDGSAELGIKRFILWIGKFIEERLSFPVASLGKIGQGPTCGVGYEVKRRFEA